MDDIDRLNEIQGLRERFPNLTDNVLSRIVDLSFADNRTPTTLNNAVEARAMAGAVAAALNDTWFDFSDNENSRALDAVQTSLIHSGLRYSPGDAETLATHALGILNNVRDAGEHAIKR